jgi:SAM-dependent methyltransferase
VSVDRSRAFVSATVPESYARNLAGQLFEPWARELLGLGGPWAGASVLDVACGTGVVARAVAGAVGSAGSVVAADISQAMLAVARRTASPSGSAPIEYVEANALQLSMADESCQFVTCQQGLQFFPDRAAAVTEFRRVLGVGGVVLAAVWAAEHPLGLFGPIGEVLREQGLPEPYPRAFQPGTYVLGADELRELFVSGGFTDVTVEPRELSCEWPSSAEAAQVVFGTPFGPLVLDLAPGEQAAILAALGERLGSGSPLTVRTFANLVRASG